MLTMSTPRGTLIYEPKGRAREYAALACNTYRGCDHRCIYCYAPNATNTDRERFGVPTTRAAGFLQKLNVEAEVYAPRGARTHEPILLCFTCDPYQQFDVQAKVTRQAIQILHRRGLPVQVLTKGGSRALRDLDLFTPADAFATTLTLLDDEASLRWEPGATVPSDRIATIRAFHSAGIPTWVSLEPVIDPRVALEIIRQTHEFVNLFKVGKLNYHPLARRIDWRRFGQQAIALLESLGKPYYVKKDLAVYLTSTAA